MTPSHADIRQLLEQALDLESDLQREALLADCKNPALAAAVSALLQLRTQASAIDAQAPWVRNPEVAVLAESPDQIGPYRITGLLGAGGMGTVYRGQRMDGSFDKQVAIKVVRDVHSAEQRYRFQREREVLATLEHPGIARVLEGGTTQAGLPWMAIEYVEGQHVDVYAQSHALDLRARVQLLCQIADAVQYAHQNLVVHRDLKPSNVLVQSTGQIKLLDFGGAKRVEANDTQTADRAPMTFAYAAPEQIKGEAITTATDVYALGVMLFELLTGERPHKPSSDTALSLLQAITDTDAVAPSEIVRKRTSTHSSHGINAARLLQGDVDTIVLKALSRDPTRRYPSALALFDDLQNYLHNRPIHARADSLRYRASKWLRRNRALAFVSALALASVIIGTGLTLHFGLEARRQAQAAVEQAEVAKTIQQVLTGIFLDADPYRMQRSDMTVKRLLTEALERSRSQLKTQPALQIPVLTDLGRAFFNVVDQQQGIEILKSAFDLASTRVPASPLEARAALYYFIAQQTYGRVDEKERLLPIIQAARFTEGSDDWIAHQTVLADLADLQTSIVQLEKLAQHPSIAGRVKERTTVRSILANKLAATEQYEQADQIYVELIDTARRNLSPVQLARLLHNRAWTTERPAEVRLALLSEATDIYRVQLGPEHLHTLNAMNILAGAKFSSDDRILEAITDAEWVIAAQRKLDGTHVIASLINLSFMHRRLRDFASAERALDEARVRADRLDLPASHDLRTGQAFAEIEVRIGQRQFARARELLAQQRELRTELGASLQNIDYAQAWLELEQDQIASAKAILETRMTQSTQGFSVPRMRVMQGAIALAERQIELATSHFQQAHQQCSESSQGDIAWCARAAYQYGSLLTKSVSTRVQGEQLMQHARNRLQRFLPSKDTWRSAEFLMQ